MSNSASPPAELGVYLQLIIGAREIRTAQAFAPNVGLLVVLRAYIYVPFVGKVGLIIVTRRLFEIVSQVLFKLSSKGVRSHKNEDFF